MKAHSHTQAHTHSQSYSYRWEARLFYFAALSSGISLNDTLITRLMMWISDLSTKLYPNVVPITNTLLLCQCVVGNRVCVASSWSLFRAMTDEVILPLTLSLAVWTQSLTIWRRDNPHHWDNYTTASRITSDYAMNDSQDYQPASKQYCSDITSPCQRYYIHFYVRPCYQISKYCWLYFAHLLDALHICGTS